MKVIVVGNQKGGVGKSMIAANLAVCAAHAGNKVMLIDADTQGTTMTWRDLRDTDDLSAVAITTTALSKDIRNFDNFDFVFIDAGGRDNASFRAAVMCARYGLLVIPVLPSASDIWATQDTLNILSEARSMGLDIPATFLINRLKSRSALGDQVKDLLEQLAIDNELGALSSILGDREDMPKAYAAGHGAIEAAPRSKAAAEMSGLYNEIIEVMEG